MDAGRSLLATPQRLKTQHAYKKQPCIYFIMVCYVAVAYNYLSAPSLPPLPVAKTQGDTQGAGGVSMKNGTCLSLWKLGV